MDNLLSRKKGERGPRPFVGKKRDEDTQTEERRRHSNIRNIFTLVHHKQDTVRLTMLRILSFLGSNKKRDVKIKVK